MLSSLGTNCAVVVMMLASIQFPSREVLDAAERRVTRINPYEIPSMPAVLSRDLLTNRCMIPQIDLIPHNAIQGHFTGMGLIDWAVLCSRNGVSAIRLYRASDPADFTEIASEPDRNYVTPTVIAHWDIVEQTMGGGFTRRITTVPAAYLRGHLGQEGLEISHDGIGDGVDGRPAYVWYWDTARWVKLGPIPLPPREAQRR